jgi:hypothetical protein
MAISEERAVSIEELLSNIHSKKEKKEDKTVNKLKTVSKNLPVGMIFFVLLVAALGVMVIMLKTEVMTFKTEVAALKTEVADFRNPKAQTAQNEQKIKIAVIENKLEESEKEKQILKSELVQVKNTLEELKNMKADKKRLAQR